MNQIIVDIFAMNLALARLNLLILLTFNLVFSAIASAQGQGDTAVPPQPSFGEVFSKMMPMFAIVFMIFYLMVIKPQQNKLRAQEKLLGELKKGDEVVTSGGIVARVSSVEEDLIVLDTGGNSKIKVEKGNVVKKRELKTSVTKQKGAAA